MWKDHFMEIRCWFQPFCCAANKAAPKILASISPLENPHLDEKPSNISMIDMYPIAVSPPTAMAGIIIYATPAHKIILNGTDIVCCCCVPNFIHLKPFPIVIKKMKVTSGMFPVPEKIKSGRNRNTCSYFGDDYGS